MKGLLTLGGLSLLVLLTSSCGDDETDTPDTVTAGEAAVVAKAFTVSLQTGFSNSSTVLTASANPQKPLAPAHEWDLECPIVDITPVLSRVEVVLDYGSGCTSQLDGQTHSGKVTISRQIPGTSLAFDFDDYTSGDFSIDGGVEGTVQANQTVALELTDLFLSSSGGTTVVDGFFAAVWDDSGTVGVLTDDSWRVRGEGIITIFSKLYLVDIEDAEPVHLKTSCAWPLSGRMSIRVALSDQQSFSPTVVLDFGSGACDDEATVTAGAQTETVHLSDGHVGIHDH